MLAKQIVARGDTSVHDRIVHLHDVSWAEYERINKSRGDGSVPRLAYLDGLLELMSPSLQHERLRSMIGRLVETWCLKRGVEFNAYGSWTLKRKQKKGGVEPDECYVFGEPRKPKRPDLAIEVIWTSGGLDKREIYQKLGVRELWFWRKGQILLYALRTSGRYEPITASEVLPGIDLDQLVSFLDCATASRAMRDYGAALARRRRSPTKTKATPASPTRRSARRSRP